MLVCGEGMEKNACHSLLNFQFSLVSHRPRLTWQENCKILNKRCIDSSYFLRLETDLIRLFPKFMLFCTNCFLGDVMVYRTIAFSTRYFYDLHFRKTIFPLMKFFHTTTSSKPRTRHGQFVQIRACIDYDLWVYFLLDYKLDRPFSKEYKSDLVFKQRYKNGECGEHAQSDFPRHCAISWTNGLFVPILGICRNF